MKRSNMFEIIGILSLSLLLTSPFAVSSCVPQMLETFPDYSRAQVEFLISCPSSAMIVMITLAPFLSRYVSDRFMVVSGLLIFGICGTTPVFTDSYPLIFLTRILMGVGIGLLNAKAITLIGVHFSGALRTRLQGIRCSMETLGQAAMMFAAGQLLVLGWNYAFLVYAVAFVILFFYLAFVPEKKQEEMKEPDPGTTLRKETPLSRAHDIKFTIQNFLLGYALVSAAVMISLRITSYLVDSGIGNATEGATVLSISVVAGFLGGISFGKIYERIRQRVLPLSLLLIAVGMAGIGFGNSLTAVSLGACIANFCVTLGSSYMFNELSVHISAGMLNTANSIVLIGCNLASCTIAFVLQWISMFSPKLSAGFTAYAGIYAVLGVLIFGVQKTASGTK